jgi:AcrR family transcriptional regulator/DNA-binding MarR family transcriptional regulator
MAARAAIHSTHDDVPPSMGRNDLQREQVADIQRARMLAAFVEVAAECGGANVTVADVVQRAGVSRRTFYDIFEDCEACLRAAFENAVKRMSEDMAAAYLRPGRWRERVRRALAAALSFLDANPSLARFLLVESQGTRAGVECRARALNRLVGVMSTDHAESTKPGMLDTTLMAEGAIGAMLGVIHGRLSEPRPGPLIELLNPLMCMLVLPYQGTAAARRELQREVPRQDGPGQAAAASVNPLKELRMRLTYRTIRALQAIATSPGSSNRLIGNASGITDQGQVSKLLGRLERLGLIENAASGATTRGEPNAWSLTQRGEDVHQALTTQATVIA